jgi:hypothetical protein
MVSAGLCSEFNRGEMQKGGAGRKKEPPENRRL